MKTLQLIPEIPIPDLIQKELIDIQNEMMKTWKKNDNWNFMSGEMPRPELNFMLDIYWETLGLIAEMNKVIGNLNIVINDMHFISNYSAMCRLLLKGKLPARYHLLTRTFFYELFRSKEIYNKYLQYLKGKNLIRKTDIQAYQTHFRSIFNDFIEIRNIMAF